MTQVYLRYDPVTEKLDDQVCPGHVETVIDEETAIKMWGEGNYVCKEIDDTWKLGLLSLDLDSNDDVQLDDAKVQAENDQLAEEAKNNERMMHFGAVEATITENMTVDLMSAIQQWVFAGKMPTDQMFINAGYTFSS